jgi:hypothetical protein
MNMNMNVKEQLRLNGYAVIHNVLTPAEVAEAKLQFHNWRNSVPDLDRIHQKCDPHGIYKHHQVGHQRHAWYVRTRPGVRKVFEEIWDTKDLACSYDGSCWMPGDEKVPKDSFWCHSDQAPTQEGTVCVQGIVGLTDNKEKTLVVWRRTHTIHREFFEAIGRGKDSARWQRVPNEYEKKLAPLRIALHIPAGAIALWDSRTFHQNQYGNDSKEERVVQYVCMLPKSDPLYRKSAAKRRKYFEERRTTSHWPYPLKVSGLQPQTYGDPTLRIDYDSLPAPNLDDLMPLIEPLV